MGVDIRRDSFSAADHRLFQRRLHEQLSQLDEVLKRPGFGAGARSLGAELELYLIDAEGRPLAISEQVVRAAATPAITPEMGRFDIELSTPPVTMEGTPFSHMRDAMRANARKISALAARYGGRAVPISILPTLRLSDFHSRTITDLPRYRALARGMCSARKQPFEIAIDGDDSLRVQSYDVVAMEAANTAFQMHVSTRPDEFANLFNAALLLTAPILAAAANSPTFLGKRLWHETRVALFKQAGDDRPPGPDGDLALPPRVNFGNGWVREGAYELFLESVALHSPLLPECSHDEVHSEIPLLHELRLHHGTVWTWNRPVYDPEGGGNLRIELRALPAGPTYDDMLANAAFLVGCMLALQKQMPQLTHAMPFTLAKRNFYLAAQHGLQAELMWPSLQGGAPSMQSARQILLFMLDTARTGLVEAGVDPLEADYFLGVLEARVRSGQTGAVWQRKVLAKLEKQGVEPQDALRQLLEHYVMGVRSQRPVHAWPIEQAQLEVDHV